MKYRFTYLDKRYVENTLPFLSAFTHRLRGLSQIRTIAMAVVLFLLRGYIVSKNAERASLFPTMQPLFFHLIRHFVPPSPQGEGVFAATVCRKPPNPTMYPIITHKKLPKPRGRWHGNAVTGGLYVFDTYNPSPPTAELPLHKGAVFGLMLASPTGRGGRA